MQTVYLGHGAVAEELMARAQEAAAARAARDQAVDKEDEKWAEAERLTAEFADEVSVLARAALIAAGFRQHDRGMWRKKRGQDGGREPDG